MVDKPLTIKTPGKLMIAGEFAVLVPYQRIVVMAVNRFVYTTIQSSQDNMLSLENFNLELEWDYVNQKIHIHSDDKRKTFVENAMTTVYTYLWENDIPVTPVHISVRSELNDASGLKYGLGSSAAVVTSVIYAILKKFLPTDPPLSLIFKLASITHVRTQGNGSGADVAASTYGGVLAYTSFQAEWLKKAIETTGSITELVHKDWIYWSVKPIHLPENVQVCIGWTGTPASTSKLVSHVLALRESNPAAFEAFIKRSDMAVMMFLQGAKTGHFPELFRGIKMNRQALVDVGHAADTIIETPLLSALSDMAEQYGGAGKSSGAGAGDCGIAFLPPEINAEEMEQKWKKQGIKPLALTISHDGSVVWEP